MTEKKQLSLFARTALMIAGGVVMTLLLYTLLRMAGRWAIETFYMSESAVETRNYALAESLQQFVSDNGVSSTDYESIEAWFALGKDADLILYQDDSIVEAGAWGHEKLSEDALDEAETAAWGYTTFTIAFADGVHRAAIADCSDLELISRMQSACMAAAFLVFVATLLTYARRISRFIRDFSTDVTAVSRGEKERVDERRGFSELDGLAHDVNQMHDVITERTVSANDAMKANSELITALSHDIRNPLTSLIGYLDLLGMESESLTDTQRQYLASSAEKADRIRALTDEMFRYFLIFSDEQPHVQTEQYDAQILFEQLLGEHAIELTAQGYTVISDPLQESCMIEADIQMLHRVLDNLFSNIRKYADVSQPVELTGTIRDRMVEMRISNGVDAAKLKSVESNRIGLRTCAVILELLGGTFRAETERGMFTVVFTLPVLAGNV